MDFFLINAAEMVLFVLAKIDEVVEHILPSLKFSFGSFHCGSVGSEPN